MSSKRFGYARVSSIGQHEDRQVEMLLAYGIPERDIFVDKQSGRSFERQQYISWWLYEGAPDYMIWSSDGKMQWCLKEPGDLYDYILDPDGRKGESSAE